MKDCSDDQRKPQSMCVAGVDEFVGAADDLTLGHHCQYDGRVG